MPASSNFRITLLVAAISAALSIAILAVMLWNAELLVRLGLVGYFWYVLLLLIGLAAAVCVFALFKSYARYTGKVLNGTLEISGPVVVMFLVILLGFWKVPIPSTRFDLTVFVHGEAGRQVLPLRIKGLLMLDLGSDRRREAIGEKGEVRFVGIPADQRSRSVIVNLDADGYELVQPNAPIVLDAETKYVAVRATQLKLAGEVYGSGNRPITGASIRVADQSAMTDADGRFSLTLPSNLPENERTLTIIAPGYSPWRGPVTPGGNPLVVRLQPSS